MGANVEKVKNKSVNTVFYFTILGISLVLFLIGVYGLVAIHAGNIEQNLKEQIQILAELKETVSKDEINFIQDAIGNISGVKEASVSFISQEEALELMKKDFGGSLLIEEMDNPFRNIMLFKVDRDFQNPDALQSIKELTEQLSGVDGVYMQDDIFVSFRENLFKLNNFVLILGIIFALISLILIHNTLQLSYLGQRFEVKSMQLVGAEWSYIRKPFIWKAILMGLVGAMVAVTGLSVLILFIESRSEIISDIISYSKVFFVFIFLIGLTLTTMIASSTYIINRFLKAGTDEMY